MRLTVYELSYMPVGARVKMSVEGEDETRWHVCVSPGVFEEEE